VLIVDDEPLARDRIRELLDDEDVVVVGEAEDGEAAIKCIETLEPDLVFLDVQMPGLSGLDVVEQVGAEAMPPVVFVTAYDQYAIQAFDVAAVDYLLKPFDDERFAEALQRAQRRIVERESREATQTLRRLLAEHQGDRPDRERGDGDPPYLERIAVQGRGQTRIVPVDDITHITADGSYAELHTPDTTHLIRERMKTLAERLDPNAFMRIHRSAIVCLDEVASILRGGGGDYAVRLRDGTRLSLSRSRVDDLKTRLGVDEM
jgi:two-component system LytT family response regulator